MKSEALEIQIEEWNDNIILCLRGRFNNEQIPNIREKVDDLLSGGKCSIIFDLSEVLELDEAVPAFLLEMLNRIRGKGGELRIIYGSGTVLAALEKYKNIFDLYPQRQNLFSGGIFKRLQTRGIILSRKTGIRISRPVATVLLIALAGWFVSLLFILFLQYAQMRKQKNELESLHDWKLKTAKKMEILQERLKPLEDLGIVTDSSTHR